MDVPLLAEDEPPPFEVVEGSTSGPFVLLCDHAGRRIPRRLGALGLSDAELERHIAWDIGAAGVARSLARRLDALAILQPYSRLVIDCNRPLDSPTSIVLRSESTDVPGNVGLSREDAAERARAIFEPYHARIRRELDARAARGQASVLVFVHSFTPVFLGVSRPFHVGVLQHRDVRLGSALLAALRSDPLLVVGDNEPYAVSPLSDFGIIEHGEARGLPCVELELRQDLIAAAEDQERWAERLALLLRDASGVFLD